MAESRESGERSLVIGQKETGEHGLGTKKGKPADQCRDNQGRRRLLKMLP